MTHEGDPVANGDDAANEVTVHEFAVAHARLNTQRRQIFFHEQAVEVQPKVFDLIEYLLRARHRVVSKEELLDHVWPNVIVTEASLTQTVKRARDLFRHNGFGDEVIRTVARKGYQFDHAVESLTPVPASAPGPGPATSDQVTTRRKPRRLLPAAAIVALVVCALAAYWALGPPPASEVSPATASSIAILPFDDLTAAKDFGYFSSGLTETLTNRLGGVAGLRVIARASAADAAQSQGDTSRIAESLGVSHLILGSVQRSGEDLRISARLVHGSSGEQIWSQQYSRRFDDVFAIQDDIARTVVEQLDRLIGGDLALTPATAVSDTAELSQAYALVLKGKDTQRRGSNQDLADAEALYREALTRVPDYADAMAALANVLRKRSLLGQYPREQGFSEALALAAEATRVDPANAAAHVEIGEIQHRHYWNFAAAERAYQQALAVFPGSAEAQAAYSRFLSKAGEYERAVTAARVAADLNPRSSNAQGNLALRLMRAGLLSEARERLDRLGKAFPDLVERPWLESNWHLLNGSYRESLSWAAQEELDYLRLTLSAIALRALERTAQAEDTLQTLIDTDADGAAFQIAEVYARWQQIDAAFEWLDRALSNGDPGLSELYSSPNLDSLRADPRFALLAQRIGLPPLP